MKTEEFNNVNNTFDESDFGNNVSLDIDLARHGKKGSFNSARIDNVLETTEMAEAVDLSGYDIVAIRSTPIERAVHTALATQEGFLKNETLEAGSVNVRVRELPTGVHSVDGVNIEKIMKESDITKDLNLISPSIREQYKNAVQNKEGSSWDKENAGVQVFIDLMEANLMSLKRSVEEVSKTTGLSVEAKGELEVFKQSQKDEGGMSMLEVVLRMSKHLNNYVEATGRLKSDTKGYVHEVNHSGFIEPFIIYLLKKQIETNPVNPEGKTDLEKIGGGFEPNEKLRISIRRQEKNSAPTIMFDIRGKVYELEADNKILSQSKGLLEVIKFHE